MVIIMDEDQLVELANQVSNYGKTCEGITIQLGADMYLSGVSWTPIGTAEINSDDAITSSSPFSGTFDGQGYTIHDLSYSSSSANCVGLFGYIRNATITRVNMENVSLTGDKGVGSIVGWADNASEALNINSKISYCSITGTIQLSGKWSIGGILGCGEKTSVTDCSVIATENSGSYIEGRDSYIETTTSENVGGIAGFIGVTQNTGRVSHMYNVAVANLDISGFRRVAGILGYTDVMGTTGDEFCITTNDTDTLNSVSNCTITINHILTSGLLKSYLYAGAVLGASYYSMTIENFELIGQVTINPYSDDVVYQGDPDNNYANKGYYGGCSGSGEITLINCYGSADIT